MTSGEINQILAAIDELREEIRAVQAWQTIRDQREHDAAVRMEERRRWLRYGIQLGKSPLTPWLFAGIGVLWATLH
jgi:hypothetical protein